MSEKKDKKNKKKVINNILLIVIFMLLSYLFISSIKFYIGYFKKYNINVSNETLKYIEKESKIIDSNMKKIKTMKSNNLSKEDIEIINKNLNEIYKMEIMKIEMIKSNKKHDFDEIIVYFDYNVVNRLKVIKILEKDDFKLNYYNGLLSELLYSNSNSVELLVTKMVNNELDDFNFDYKIKFELRSFRYLTELVLEVGGNNE